MNYTKPQITSLASANSAIQGNPKQATTTTDTHGIPDYVTNPAYEADE